MPYFVDILEPDKDLNKAVDQLADTLGVLYRRSWDDDKRQAYNDKPFNLNIGAFAQMWNMGTIRIFVAYDQATRKSVGFLIGMIFRPLPYDANVFQIEDWYALPDCRDEVEPMLFDHVAQAVRYIGCNEVWSSADNDGRAPAIAGWKTANCFNRYRYIKA